MPRTEFQPLDQYVEDGDGVAAKEACLPYSDLLSIFRP